MVEKTLTMADLNAADARFAELVFEFVQFLQDLIGELSLWVALLMIPVDLFIGVATFVRSIKINLEDARWVEGMSRIRGAYLRMVPALDAYFILGAEHGMNASTFTARVIT